MLQSFRKLHILAKLYSRQSQLFFWYLSLSYNLNHYRLPSAKPSSFDVDSISILVDLPPAKLQITFHRAFDTVLLIKFILFQPRKRQLER